MKYLLPAMSICFVIFSCNEKNLEKENEELLKLTKDLTSTVEELKLQVEKQHEMTLMAAAEAKKAQTQAERQAMIAKESLEEANRQRFEAFRLAEKLKNCQ